MTRELMTPAEASAWRMFAARIVQQARVDYVCARPPGHNELPPGEFLDTELCVFIVESLGRDIELVREEWERRSREFDELLESGTKEEFTAWRRRYFPGYPRFNNYWKRMRERT